jgi:hypothetical protein
MSRCRIISRRRFLKVQLDRLWLDRMRRGSAQYIPPHHPLCDPAGSGGATSPPVVHLSGSIRMTRPSCTAGGAPRQKESSTLQSARGSTNLHGDADRGHVRRSKRACLHAARVTRAIPTASRSLATTGPPIDGKVGNGARLCENTRSGILSGGYPGGPG